MSEAGGFEHDLRTMIRERRGLGLKEEDAGTIIGIVTFALYLMPVITGTLGDRFGYKKMFLLAYAILTPCY